MLAISVENVGKHYVLGKPRTGRSLRQVVESVVHWPARALFSKGQRSSHERPSLWALKDVDFRLNHGDILGIIGKNGSGKSTLLKIISRLTRPTEGKVQVFGKVGSLLEVGVGFNPELSGRENIYLNGAIIGMSTEEVDAKFQQIVQFAGLEDFIDTAVKNYSSGMYMRLAFSVAAHLDPDILLLDEVLAVGDLDFQRRCLKKVAQFRDQGKTILLVSHSMSPITDLCTKALWLDRGRVAAFGEPRAVVQSYLRKDQSQELGVEVIPPEKDPEPTVEESEEQASEEDNETEAVSAETEREEEPDLTGPAVDAALEESPVEEELPWGEVRYEPHAANQGVKVWRAYVCSEGQEGLAKVAYEKDYQLVIHYEVPEKIIGLRIGYKFYNERNQVVLHTVTNDPVNDPQNVGDPGAHVTTVHIPGALFAPGTFDVEIGVWSPLVGHHMSQNAYRFEIVNPTVDSIGMEVLRPIFRWEVQ